MATFSQLADLSILVTNYNKAAFIEGFIPLARLVLKLGAEVILIDDGSTDGSYSALRDFELNQTGAFQLIRTKNQGAGPARALSILKATRPYVFFLDIDDSVHVDNLIEVVCELKRVDADLAIGNYCDTLTGCGRVMPVQKNGFEIVLMQDYRDKILEAMGWWRYIYRREIILQKHNILGSAFSNFGGKTFVLDDIFWMLHLTSQNFKLLVSPEKYCIYKYFLPTIPYSSGDRYLLKISYLPKALLEFSRHIREFNCNHNQEWLRIQAVRIIWNHIPLLPVHRFLFTYIAALISCIKVLKPMGPRVQIYNFLYFALSFGKRIHRILLN